MGTAMRFFVVLAGLGFMVFAFAMIGGSLYEVFSDFFADPLGNSAVLLMLATVAAAPFYVGVRLVRKAMRDETAPARRVDASESVRPLASYARAGQPIGSVNAGDVDPLPAAIGSPAPEVNVEASQMPESAASAVAAPTNVRRPKLAYAGLALALVGVLVELNIFVVLAVRPPSTGGEWFGFAAFIVLASLPLMLGLWLARRGDPEIGRRLLSDLGVRMSDLRQPARWLALLSTSYGFAIATYFVAAPLMVIWRAQSAEIGVAALMLYSLFDPALNLTRPSWWMGAIVSFGVGMALFFALLLTAGILRHLGDDQYNFMYPLLLYIPAMGLLGLVRFFDNLRRSD
jgi:hypothetical protein